MADEDRLRELIAQINRENEEKKRGEIAKYIPEEYRGSAEEELRRAFEESRKSDSPIENMPQRRGSGSKAPYMQKMPYRRGSGDSPYIKKL
jgi:hypothetical protein